MPTQNDAQRMATAAPVTAAPWRVKQRAAQALGVTAVKPAKLLRVLGIGCLRLILCSLLVHAALDRVRPQSHVDLYPGYVAAHFANEGRWDRIYHRSIWLHNGLDREWDLRASQLTLQPVLGTSFVYHPYYLELLRPIAAHWTYRDFQQAWIKLNELCVAAAGIGIALLLGYRSFAGQALIALALALAAPTIDSIQHGQNVLPALVCALAAAACWSSRAPLWAGALFMMLAWACKPWCAILLGLCFALRGVRAGLITSVAVGFVMGFLPKLIMPADLMRDYQDLTMAMTSASVWGHNNISLLSVLERMQYHDWARHLSEWIPRVADLKLRLTALGIAGAVFACGALLWWWRKPAARFTTVAFLGFAIMPLGICWTHYFVFALPLACLCSFDSRSPYILRAVGLGFLYVLLNLLNIVFVTPELQAVYVVAPPAFPTDQALPMIALAVTCLSCMALAPREHLRGAGAWRF